MRMEKLRSQVVILLQSAVELVRQLEAESVGRSVEVVEKSRSQAAGCMRKTTNIIQDLELIIMEE